MDSSVSKIISIHQRTMTADERALLLNVTPGMSRIIAIISDKLEPDYTMRMRE